MIRVHHVWYAHLLFLYDHQESEAFIVAISSLSSHHHSVFLQRVVYDTLVIALLLLLKFD